MQESKVKMPTFGEKITMGADGKLNVPNFPIIPYVEGDGTGPDITAAAMIVWDAIFSKLMGDEVEPRRKFIEENAGYVQNLDI